MREPRSKMSAGTTTWFVRLLALVSLTGCRIDRGPMDATHTQRVTEIDQEFSKEIADNDRRWNELKAVVLCEANVRASYWKAFGARYFRADLAWIDRQKEGRQRVRAGQATSYPSWTRWARTCRATRAVRWERVRSGFAVTSAVVCASDRPHVLTTKAPTLVRSVRSCSAFPVGRTATDRRAPNLMMDL
jgi:hypothetical protein